MKETLFKFITEVIIQPSCTILFDNLYCMFKLFVDRCTVVSFWSNTYYTIHKINRGKIYVIACVIFRIVNLFTFPCFTTRLTLTEFKIEKKKKVP